MVVANAMLLRGSFRGLTGLVQRMETLDVLQPRQRLPLHGRPRDAGADRAFNGMLERLEIERRRAPGGRCRRWRASGDGSGRSCTTRSGSG